MLADLQAAFRAALLDRSLPVPAGVTSHHADGPARRYAVHRNTVLSSLIEALHARFPVAARIAGDDFFREAARRFVLHAPPRSPVLLHYGDGLPAFVERFDEIAGLPYWPDILRLEVAWSQSYHAADARPVAAEALAALPPARLCDVRVALHPSVRLLRSAYPVVTIFRSNRDDAAVRPIEDWSGEDALVSRPGLDVDVIRLPPGGFAFLEALQARRILGEAFEAAVADAATFDASAALAGLVSAGRAVRFAL